MGVSYGNAVRGTTNWWITNVALAVACSARTFLGSSTMTAASTSKAKARQRAVDAFRRAKKERAARVRGNLKDATVLLHAVDKLADTAEWKKARRAEPCTHRPTRS